MYKLLISFDSDINLKFGLSRTNEYFLTDEVEVCKVISKLSHLKPFISLCYVSLMSAEDVLKVFELKEV